MYIYKRLLNASLLLSGLLKYRFALLISILIASQLQ